RRLVIARESCAIVAWYRSQVGARQVDDHVALVDIQPSLSDRNEYVVARRVFREVLVERDLDITNPPTTGIEEHVLYLTHFRPVSRTDVPATRVRLILRELEAVEVPRVHERAVGGIGRMNRDTIAILFCHVI